MIVKQTLAIWTAPVPFTVCLIIVTALVWRAMKWIYEQKLERLKDDVAWAERQVRRKSAEEHAALSVQIDPSVPLRSEVHIKADAGLLAPKERIFLPKEATPENLASLRLRSSGVETDRQLASYKGKWIHFSGIVEATGFSMGETYVRLNPGERSSLRETFAHQVTVYPSSLSANTVEFLTPGQSLSGIAEIEDVGTFGIILIKAEFD
ncbi:hypothetical protein [Sphingomonas sp. ID0503]|uniref:hypothetical protein n=1 Tax=Sphingomonas sp. ID0503 TaxID=3399691 RepID=UPI003AFAC98D